LNHDEIVHRTEAHHRYRCNRQSAQRGHWTRRQLAAHTACHCMTTQLQPRWHRRSLLLERGPLYFGNSSIHIGVDLFKGDSATPRGTIVLKRPFGNGVAQRESKHCDANKLLGITKWCTQLTVRTRAEIRQGNPWRCCWDSASANMSTRWS
jgi:hypothetical protein